MISAVLAMGWGTIFVLVSCLFLWRLKFFKKVLLLMNKKSLWFGSTFLTIAIGLAMVVAHTRWVLDWPLFLTLLGWATLLKGLDMLFFPQRVQERWFRTTEKRWIQLFWFLFLFGIAFASIGIYTLVKKSGELSKNAPAVEFQSTAVQGISESSDPFRDLTIPYLRTLSYGGVLDELKPYQKRTTYNSFLTAYTAGGLRIEGLVTIPKGEMPDGGWPAIVFVHGYIPPTTYRTTQKYLESVDYLARNGYVVFKIDLRGHGNSEGEAEGAYYSSGDVVDVLNAYETLRTQSFVNPNRVGLWGHSMAGNIVLRSVVAHRRIPAAVIWAGAVFTYDDFIKYRIQDNSYRPTSMSTKNQERRKMLFSTHGEFSAESPFWSQVSPANYLSDVETRFSLHHAQNDTVVNIGYSRDLNDLLKKNGMSHEFFEYTTGGHNLVGSSFGRAMQRTVEFYKKNL